MIVSKKLFKENSGIYCIKNNINNRVYIGQSKNIYKRLILHKHRLRTKSHSNSYLQRSVDKYGILNFSCSVLKYTKTNLTNKERFYINKFKKVYNLKEAIDSVDHPIRIVTENTIKKLSKGKKGKLPSNLSWLQQKNRRKLNYYINGNLIKTFISCKEAAEYFNLKPNDLHQYIGVSRKTKKFPRGYRLEYVESRERRFINV